MAAESWFKVSMPALPFLFTLFGIGGYWNENPLPLLAPNMAFWGVVVAFYLFTRLYVPESRLPFIMSVSTALLWLVSAITGHNLALFIASDRYHGLTSIALRTDFWYSYVSALIAAGLAVVLFIRHEPEIVAQSERYRRRSRTRR